MEIVEVEIAPSSPVHVTPLEVLEDFADSVPGWQYLEDDSELYAAVRGRPACVLRAAESGATSAMDFAFLDASGDEGLKLRLSVICPAESAEVASGEARMDGMRRFLSAFNRYAQTHPNVVEIHPVERHPAAWHVS